MSDNCISILNEVPKELVDSDLLKHIMGNVSRFVDSPNSRERFEQFISELEGNLNKKLSRSTMKRYMSILAVKNIEHGAKQFRDYHIGLEAELVGRDSNVKGSKYSLDALMKSVPTKFLSKFLYNIDKDNLDTYFKNVDNEMDIAKAIWDPLNNSNKNARKIADHYRSLMDKIRKMQNNRGAEIESLEGWMFHQVHDPNELVKTSKSQVERAKIRSQIAKEVGWRNLPEIRKRLTEIAYKRWENFILPRLDLARSFDLTKDIPESLRMEKAKEILRGVYDTLVKGSAPGDELVFSSKSDKIGSFISSKRVLHFKNAQSAVEVNKEFNGSGGLHQSMVKAIEHGGKNIAILSKMGPMPDAVFETVKANLIRDSDDPRVAQKMNKTDKYFKSAMNRDMQPVSHLWANTSSAIRNMVGMAKLGGVVLRALPDVVQEIGAMRSQGIGFLDSYGVIMNQFKYMFPLDEDMNRFMKSFGVMTHSIMGHYNNKWTALDSPKGAMSKAMGVYYKLNFMEQWDRSIRLGFATALGKNLAELRGKSFDKLPIELQKTFGSYGIEGSHWDVIRSNTEAMKVYKNQMYVTPDMADDFTDESLQKFVGKNTKLTSLEKEKALEDVSWRLNTYFQDQADHAQLAPRAREKALMLHGTQPGTVPGELLRFLFQFKGYALAITTKGVGKLLLENSNSTVMQSILENKISHRALGEYMMNAIAFGYLSNAATNLVKNGSIPNPENYKTIIDAGVQGGGFGIFGDLVNHNYNKYGQGLLGLLGPVAGTTSDTLKLLSLLADVDNKGHRLSYSQGAVKGITNYVKHNAPFSNMFYAKLAAQQLVKHGIVNNIMPDYMQANRQKQDDDNQSNLQVF